MACWARWLLLLLLPAAALSDWATLDAAGAHFSLQCSAAPLPHNFNLCAHAPAAPLAPLPPAAAGAPLLHAAWGYAGALSDMKRHAAAAALRGACLAQANATAAPLPWATAAAAHAALAHDLRHHRAYPQALAALQGALQAAPPASPTAALLHAFQAELLSCSGEGRAVEALAALARARRLAAASGGASGEDASAALQELDLLRRALRSPALPQALRAGLAAKYEGLVAGMLAAGPWRKALQLPRHFSPELWGAPWHEVGSWGAAAGAGGAAAPPPGFPRAALAAAVRALEAAVPALALEYQALRDGGHLEPETECIVEPRWGNSSSSSSSSGHHGERGGWWVYTANAWWLRPLDGSGCSVASPVACALRAQLGALGLAVQRVGYSALWPGALLHPHYGLSNSVLKLHLGVRVPVQLGTGRGCAALTVGGETRAWEQGRVLAFDDSYLHSVEFSEEGGCREGGERVVLQVVLVHPQVAEGGGGLLWHPLDSHFFNITRTGGRSQSHES